MDVNDRSDRPPSTWRRSIFICALPASLGPLAFLASPSSSGPPPPPDPTLELAAEIVSQSLPVERNDRVERWVRHWLQNPEDFQVQLSRKGRFAALIEGELLRRDLPRELIYLALIESGFSPTATSPVAAAGLWQFMPPTARAFGLRVDGWVDERRDPVLATAAALDYLQELHELFGTWPLALAAYNAGPDRVTRALRIRGGAVPEGAEPFWEILPQLPRETREFVPRLMAAAILARQAERYGFQVEMERPYEFDRVFVPGGTSLVRVASALQIQVAELRELNPHLVRGVTPPGVSYAVRVPVGDSNRVVVSLSRYAD